MIGKGKFMNIDEIIKMRPEVSELLTRCETLSNSTMNWYQKNHAWYRDLKPTLLATVGFMSTTVELNNTTAYDLVYHRCIELARI